MVERAVELIHRVRAERVAHLRAVKRDADDAVFALVSDEPVVGDIGEIREAFHWGPQFGLERVVGAVFRSCLCLGSHRYTITAAAISHGGW